MFLHAIGAQKDDHQAKIHLAQDDDVFGSFLGGSRENERGVLGGNDETVNEGEEEDGAKAVADPLDDAADVIVMTAPSVQLVRRYGVVIAEPWTEEGVHPAVQLLEQKGCNRHHDDEESFDRHGSKVRHVGNGKREPLRQVADAHPVPGLPTHVQECPGILQI